MLKLCKATTKMYEGKAGCIVALVFGGLVLAVYYLAMLAMGDDYGVTSVDYLGGMMFAAVMLILVAVVRLLFNVFHMTKHIVVNVLLFLVFATLLVAAVIGAAYLISNAWGNESGGTTAMMVVGVVSAVVVVVHGAGLVGRLLSKKR